MRFISRAALEPQWAAIGALRAEMATLREENARLRLSNQQLAAGLVGSDRIGQIAVEADRFLDVQRLAARAANAADEAWQRLADALVLRDALIDVCDQLVAVSSRLRRRLEELSPWPDTPGVSITDAGGVAMTAEHAVSSHLEDG